MSDDITNTVGVFSSRGGRSATCELQREIHFDAIARHHIDTLSLQTSAVAHNRDGKYLTVQVAFRLEAQTLLF